MDANAPGKPNVTDDGFDVASDEFLTVPIDINALAPRERRWRRVKDCFWSCEASLAYWFGLEDSKFEYELDVKAEEDEERAKKRSTNGVGVKANEEANEDADKAEGGMA